MTIKKSKKFHHKSFASRSAQRRSNNSMQYLDSMRGKGMRIKPMGWNQAPTSLYKLWVVHTSYHPIPFLPQPVPKIVTFLSNSLVWKFGCFPHSGAGAWG
eukprot:6250711-Amphidinium_carterae.1